MSRKQKTLFVGGIAKECGEDDIKTEFCRLFDVDKDQWNNAKIEIVQIQKKPLVLVFINDREFI